MDIKFIFLYGNIDIELYIEQPKMFKELDYKTWVYRLKKGLYGLKQARHIWNKILHNYLIEYRYTSLELK